MCMVLEKRLEKSCKSAHFAKITSNKLKIKNTWESLPVLTPLIAPRPLPEAPVLGYTRHSLCYFDLFWALEQTQATRKTISLISCMFSLFLGLILPRRLSHGAAIVFSKELYLGGVVVTNIEAHNKSPLFCLSSSLSLLQVKRCAVLGNADPAPKTQLCQTSRKYVQSRPDRAG